MLEPRSRTLALLLVALAPACFYEMDREFVGRDGAVDRGPADSLAREAGHDAPADSTGGDRGARLDAGSDILARDTVAPDASTPDAVLDGGVPDTSADAQPPDTQVADSLAADQATDGPIPDASLPDLAPDLPPPDLPPPDLGPPVPDFTAPDAGCVEPPSVNRGASACDQQCVNSTGDADCDGLPDVRDPQVGCNTLIFSDDFVWPPQSVPYWTPSAGISWSCGAAQMTPGDTLLLADPIWLPPGGPYMLETQFTLGATTDPGWSVQLVTRDQQGYGCRLYYNLGKPTLNLYRDQSCGPGGITSGAITVDDAVGKTYILQLYPIGQKFFCRIQSPDGSFSEFVSYTWTNCPLATPDQFRVLTPYRNVTVDWIHAFRMN